MPFSPELPVMIVGAGTGGLALAHGLRHAGIPVRVYERDRTRTGGLQGYRVGISPNGVRSLRACLPPELFDAFVDTTARDYEGFGMYTERFAPLITISSDCLLAQDDVVKDYSVSRMTLRQVLLTGLDDIVRFDKKFSHFEDNGDSATTSWSSQWRRDGEHQGGVGGTDAELVRRWPGLLFDNTADYVSRGVSASRGLLPADVLEWDGARRRGREHRAARCGTDPRQAGTGPGRRRGMSCTFAPTVVA